MRSQKLPSLPGNCYAYNNYRVLYISAHIIYMYTHTHIQSYRRIFQWLSYTLFFYNALLGLLAAIFRVLISTCINLLLMIRLDRPVAQQLDTGNWI